VDELKLNRLGYFRKCRSTDVEMSGYCTRLDMKLNVHSLLEIIYCRYSSALCELADSDDKEYSFQHA